MTKRITTGRAVDGIRRALDSQDERRDRIAQWVKREPRAMEMLADVDRMSRLLSSLDRQALELLLDHVLRALAHKDCDLHDAADLASEAIDLGLIAPERVQSALHALRGLRKTDEKRRALADRIASDSERTDITDERAAYRLAAYVEVHFYVKNTEELKQAARVVVKAWRDKTCGRGNKKHKTKWEALNDFANLIDIGTTDPAEFHRRVRAASRAQAKRNGRQKNSP